MKILRMQIHPVQNIRKVLISRENTPGLIWGHFRQNFPWAENMQTHIGILHISLGGPMGPIHLVWGHVLVSCLCQFWMLAKDSSHMLETLVMASPHCAATKNVRKGANMTMAN